MKGWHEWGGILGPKEPQETTFAWGFRVLNNNQAKAYALLHGLLLAISSNIELLIVISNSRVIIKDLVHQTTPKDNRLTFIVSQINKVVQSMTKILSRSFTDQQLSSNLVKVFIIVFEVYLLQLQGILSIIYSQRSL